MLDAASSFRHIGLHVVSNVPIAEPNEFAAIIALSHKIKRLTGRDLRMLDWETRHEQPA